MRELQRRFSRLMRWSISRLLLVGLVLSLMVYAIWSNFEQPRRTVETIEAAGCVATFSKPTYSLGWVDAYLPKSYRCRVLELDILCTVNEAKVDFQRLSHLRYLKRLHIDGGANVTDEDLMLLGANKAVEVIDLYHTEISDVGLEVLCRSFDPEKILLLGCGRISGSGLSSIASPEKVVEMNLQGTSFRFPFESNIKKCRNLEVLSMEGTLLNDEAFENISSMPSLRKINLEFTRLTRRSLPALVGMKQLESLSLGTVNWRISPDDFQKLTVLKKLTYLEISYPEMVNEEWNLAPLRELPNLRVFSNIALVVHDSDIDVILEHSCLTRLEVKGVTASESKWNELRTKRPELTIKYF